MPGYSGTPLYKKLGIKPGFKIYVKNAPDNYTELISPIPDGVMQLQRVGRELDMIHFFTKKRSEMEKNLPIYMQKIKQDAMIWLSWPKKASNVQTDIYEDTIRAIALPMGLVDIKVCAVDETWSGLKLVIRKELRSKMT
ncbi:MAG: DUF3052 domain-containing protein [Calditrichia bacterium]